MDERFELWVEEFFKGQVEPLSPKLSKVFVILTMDELNNTVDETPVAGNRAYRILSGRCDTLGLNISPATKIFLSLLCLNPGDAVMYASSLRYYQLKHRIPIIRMHELATIFPRGFPTPDFLSQIWDKQKLDAPIEDVPIGGNLLDTLSLK